MRRYINKLSEKTLFLLKFQLDFWRDLKYPCPEAMKMADSKVWIIIQYQTDFESLTIICLCYPVKHESAQKKWSFENLADFISCEWCLLSKRFVD